MKKSLLTILISLCLIACLTGCKKEEKYNVLKDRPTTTQKVNTEEQEVENVKKTDELNYYTYITENRDVVAIFNNISNKNIDAHINMQYKDGSGKVIDTVIDSIYCIEPTKEVAIVLGENKEWDIYDLNVKSNESKKKSHLDQVKITHENTGKEIKVKITNTLKETIDSIDVSVGYYDKDGALVGFEHSDVVSLEGQLTGELKIDYPRDNRNRKVDFATYKVYINEIYSEK